MAGLRIRWLYPLCRGQDTLNLEYETKLYQYWGLSSGYQGSVEYPFIIIPPRFTLVGVLVV